MKNSNLHPRLASFKYAFQGIWDLFHSQPNARIHLGVLLIVIIAGIFIKISLLEWALIALSSATVLAAEAANTAIEYLTNLVSPDYHSLAGKAKDAAAACVLLTAFGAALVGAIIFLPRIWQLLSL